MNDTDPDVERRMHALFMTRSGTERVLMMSEMFDCARALLVADIRATCPGISAADLRIRILERTYGGDLTPRELAAVIARFRADRGRDSVGSLKTE